MQTWFVTGASRGLGREIARAELEAGYSVVATARRPEGGGRGNARQCGTNNAGRGLLGAVEEVPDSETRTVVDINVFGALAVTRASLPVLGARNAGTVVMISSVGGFTQGPGWGTFGATNAAIEGSSASLSAELGPLGIKVVIVEPGIFRTDFKRRHGGVASGSGSMPTMGYSLTIRPGRHG